MCLTHLNLRITSDKLQMQLWFCGRWGDYEWSLHRISWGNDKCMTESNIASIKAAMSISDLLCVQRHGNRSWSPGCQWRCRGVSAAWRQYWSVWLTLPSSPILSSPPSQIKAPLRSLGLKLPAQLHWPLLLPFWDCWCQALHRSLFTSPTGIWTSRPLTVSEGSSSLTGVPQGVRR